MIVFWFVDRGQVKWELVRHRMSDATTLDRAHLKGVPAHAQEVVLNAHLAIAVSYRL